MSTKRSAAGAELPLSPVASDVATRPPRRKTRRGGARSPSANALPVPAEVSGVSRTPEDGEDWPRISFVIPGLNESESIPELASRITKAMEGGDSYEIIFVDDGSTDDMWAVIQKLSDGDKRIRGARLRRNFGKAMALKAGFRRAKGDIIVTLDADLQDDPSDIPAFIEKIEEGFDVVVGWKVKRLDPTNRLILSRIFNGVVRMSTGVKLHDMNCGFKAYRREVVQSVPIYGDLFRFFPAMAAAEGFKITEVPVKHHARAFGKSRYGLERILRGFLDLFSVFFLTRYQRKPMHFFGLLGVILGVLGFGTGSYLTIEWFRGYKIGDRPLLLLSVLLVLVGLQLFSVGLIGEYLTYQRAKRKSSDFSAVREHIR
ncbi:MAG: glycosyltransferase family 2 protein [Polyangiaceae bacterium]